VEFIIIASTIPPFEHSGSWLVDGFVLTVTVDLGRSKRSLGWLMIAGSRVLGTDDSRVKSLRY